MLRLGLLDGFFYCKSSTCKSGTKKGGENVVANHLSRLTITHNTHNPPINDEFPEESLLLVENTPWYAHIANYLATGELLADWKA